jgi:hypothetical protein
MTATDQTGSRVEFNYSRGAYAVNIRVTTP